MFKMRIAFSDLSVSINVNSVYGDRRSIKRTFQNMAYVSLLKKNTREQLSDTKYR